MENFLVSARKYRPTTFDMVVGQEHITHTLKNAIKNQTLAQSYLFSGPRGVGKTTCARIFAKTINCQNLKANIEPCNECESCLSFNRSASFNIFELDAASNSSVEDIRNLVDQVRIPPQSVRYKVYIIDEVHMLSNNAFNAFLKTLEEPPWYAKFILATTEKHKIIPTILSRCQIYDFKRITIRDITRYLEYVARNEGVEVDPEALQLIAQKADGAMRDALSMFDQLVSFAGRQLTYSMVAEHLNVLDYDYYFRIVDFLLDGNNSECLLTFNKIIEAGFDGQHFITGLAEHLRNLLICTDDKTLILLESGEKTRERYLEQATRCKPSVLLPALDVLQKADFNYKTSNNKRLHVEITLLQLSRIFQPKQFQSESQSISSKNTNTRAEIITPPTNQSASPQSKDTASIPPQSSKKLSSVTSIKTDNAKIPSTISIKNQSEAKHNETNKSAIPDQPAEVSSPAGNVAIDRSEFQNEWKKLADSLPKELWGLKTLMYAVHPELNQDNVIHLEVVNTIQQKDFYVNQELILNYLKNKLRNPHLSLKVTVNADAPSVKPYTPDEVYRFMANKNPSLEYWREKFGLSPDY